MNHYSRRRRLGSHQGFGALLYVVGSIAVISLVALLVVGPYLADTTRVCTVEGKDRAAGQNSSSMRVYTKDCGNLSVDDALLLGHFSSSDVYREIEPGVTYQFRTIGWRIPFLSMFPNIVEAREVDR